MRVRPTAAAKTRAFAIDRRTSNQTRSILNFQIAWSNDTWKIPKKSCMKTTSTFRQEKDPLSRVLVADQTSPVSVRDNTRMSASRCPWRKRSSEVLESASGVTKQSQTAAITARSATGASWRWTITVPGWPTASASTTISSSSACSSTVPPQTGSSSWPRTQCLSAQFQTHRASTTNSPTSSWHPTSCRACWPWSSQLSSRSTCTWFAISTRPSNSARSAARTIIHSIPASPTTAAFAKISAQSSATTLSSGLCHSVSMSWS